MILADLGADVLKVERPGLGDDARRFAPFYNGESVPYLTMNRNKRSITLDLKSEAGIAEAMRLGRTADVLVESFRPGKTEALGLGHDKLSDLNDRLIYAAVSAFGDTGPGRDLPGYDPIIQAFSGLMSMTGEESSGPIRVAASVTDLSTGMWLAIGVLAALAERDRTGRGMRVSTSLIDSMMIMLNHQVSHYLLSGEAPKRLGSGSPTNVPYEALRTRDGHVMVAPGNDRLFAKFADVIGVPELTLDERYQVTAQRVAHRRPLIELIEAVTVLRPTRSWVEAFRAAGIPCAPVNDLPTALADPVITERGVVTAANGHPSVPRLPVVDLPLRSDGAGLGPHRPPPTLGQHMTLRPDWLAPTRANPAK